MNYEEYRQDVYNDAIEYMGECLSEGREIKFDYLFDEMLDSITGNASGSYYYDSGLAAESVADVIWDYRIHDLAHNAFGDDVDIPMDRGPEVFDVYVRFLLLEDMYSELKAKWDDMID